MKNKMKVNNSIHIWGTEHFVDMNSAVKYYREQTGESLNLARRSIETKLKDKSIVIGPPTLKPNQRLKIKVDEGRYFIEELEEN